MAYKTSVTPQQDTGWGVIFRLNDLFREVESLAPSGKYDEWNIKLDRIFSNLVYRNPFKIVKDKNDKIVSIEFDEEAYDIKTFFDEQILKHKKEMNEAKKKIPSEKDEKTSREWIVAKKKLYKAIFIKEIWLRKYMQSNGLYLKEVEHNPAGAMWGK
jgi:hypothetical protein